MIHIGPFYNESAVFLENERLRAVILPQHGGKVASLYLKHRQFELLFQNPKPFYSPARPYDPFYNFEACGFDDAFPTIDACEVRVGDKKVLYPDHGEIWSTPFDFRVENNRVVMACAGGILPWRYEKILELKEDRLHCSYRITNMGETVFPYLWAFHCLVNYRSDMELVFPGGVEQVENVCDSPALGKAGTVYRFPDDETADGSIRSFGRVPPTLPRSAEKFYVRGRVTQGKCGYRYPSEDVTALVEYDAAKLPYLGFWCTAGGFRGDYNCALEPASAYYDSIPTAVNNHAVSVLHPGETISFSIRVTLRKSS